MNFNMNGLDKTLMELHGMLKTAEASMKKPNNSNPTAPILAVDRSSAKRKCSGCAKERIRNRV